MASQFWNRGLRAMNGLVRFGSAEVLRSLVLGCGPGVRGCGAARTMAGPAGVGVRTMGRFPRVAGVLRQGGGGTDRHDPAQSRPPGDELLLRVFWNPEKRVSMLHTDCVPSAVLSLLERLCGHPAMTGFSLAGGDAGRLGPIRIIGAGVRGRA